MLGLEYSVASQTKYRKVKKQKYEDNLVKVGFKRVQWVFVADVWRERVLEGWGNNDIGSVPHGVVVGFGDVSQKLCSSVFYHKMHTESDSSAKTTAQTE